jgi:predicted RNase H-related nuclease YkuK (DUF458 family)
MLKSLNYDFLDDYSFENLYKLRDIFSKISTYNGRILYGSHVNPREIIPTFISVIESFGNKELLEYYKEKISNLKANIIEEAEQHQENIDNIKEDILALSDAINQDINSQNTKASDVIDNLKIGG